MAGSTTNVTLTLGLASVSGKLNTVTESNGGKREEVHLLCPDCKKPTQWVSQRYVCVEDPKHGPYEPAALKRGQQVGETIVEVDVEKLAEARASVLPKAQLDLQPHRREDVEAKTFPKGNVYVFTPVDAQPMYGILIELLKQHPDLVLIAKTNLRQKDHLMQVDVGMNGQLLVREMVWPEDFKSFQAPQYDAPQEKMMNLAETLMTSLVDDFSPDEYRKDSRARVAAVVEEATGAKPKGKKAAAPKEVPADDLTAVLEAAIAAQGKKGKKAS